MMECMPELSGFRRHYEAGAKQTERESYGGSTLLELSLYVLQGCSMVHGDTKFIFQLHEYFRELVGADIQWETLCPEDSAAWDAVGETCLYLLLIECNRQGLPC